MSKAWPLTLDYSGQQRWWCLLRLPCVPIRIWAVRLVLCDDVHMLCPCVLFSPQDGECRQGWLPQPPGPSIPWGLPVYITSLAPLMLKFAIHDRHQVCNLNAPPLRGRLVTWFSIPCLFLPSTFKLKWSLKTCWNTCPGNWARLGEFLKFDYFK